MAVSPLDMTWQECLSKHPLLAATNPEESDRHCVAENDGDLFLWKNDDKYLCYINLKRMQSYVQSGGKDPESLDNYQMLVCSQVPQFTVQRVKFSPFGQFVALIGRRQVMIMQLPTSRGRRGLYGDGRPQVSCRSFQLAERFLSAGSHVKVLQLHWHPSSASETHILILTSDNIVRLYCFSRPQKSLQTYAVAPGSGFHGSRSNLSDTTRAISLASTEGVVDFDILPVETLTTCLNTGDGNEVDNSCLVFALMDSGDVYAFQSTLPSSSGVPPSRPPPVYGPLRMQPAAEDNYGSDSCAVCCLPSHPPVLVIASAEGRLFHCLIMADESDDDDEEAQPHWATQLSFKEPTLFVFEGVALSLPDDVVAESVDSQEGATASDQCLTVHHVGSACDRYFCSHGSGIHRITLPWLRQMERFCATDDEGTKDVELDEVNLQQECQVEHLVSSRPFEHSPPSPMHSFCAVSNPFLGNTLVCITGDGACSTVDLRRSPSTTAAATFAEPTENGERAQAAEAQVATSELVQEVSRMLSERGSMPILRLSGAPDDMTPKMAADMLKSTTDTFRDRHFPVMRKVASTIAKRSKTLTSQKQHQQRDCAAILSQFQELQAGQIDIDRRSRTLLKAQEDLAQRLNRVFHSLEFQAPVRSIAEEKMSEDLRSMSLDLRKCQHQLDSVRKKVDFHKTAQERKETGLSSHHQQSIRSLIKKDTEDIEHLVSQVNTLSLQPTS